MQYGSTMVQSPEDIGGLCHLVEAATALSSLGCLPTKTASEERKKCFVSDDDEEDDNLRKNGARCRREFFPQRLMTILNDKSLVDVVSWLPNGRSFVVIRPDVFTEEVLPKYLPPVDARSSTKYPSFTRKLNRWGFRQVTRGTDTGAFHHPLFRRDQPDLCLDMVCQRGRDRKAIKKINNLPPKKRVCQGLPPSKSGHQKILVKKRSRSPQVISSPDKESVVPTNKLAIERPFSPIRDDIANAVECTELSRNLIDSDDNMAPAQLLVNDQCLLERAFEQNQENARIRAAQAMLYASFLKALQG